MPVFWKLPLQYVSAKTYQTQKKKCIRAYVSRRRCASATQTYVWKTRCLSRKNKGSTVHSFQNQVSRAGFTIHFNIFASAMWPDQYWEITSAQWETQIPLKWQDWRMTELTVFSYRTLKMHSGKGARKSAQLATSCSSNWPYASLPAKITDTGPDRLHAFTAKYTEEYTKQRHHRPAVCDGDARFFSYPRPNLFGFTYARDGIFMMLFHWKMTFIIQYSAHRAQQHETMKESFMLLFCVNWCVKVTV